MANAYHRGKRVSVSHAAMLAAYERDTGRTVYINQGRRTLAEQARFYAAYLRGGTLAARPYPGAPHIKWGREHHALDINAPEPAQSVARYYRSHGVPVSFNVPGEPWHMDPTDERRLKLAARHAGVTFDPIVRHGQVGPSVIRVKKLLHDRGYGRFGSRFNPYMSQATVDAVRRFQARRGLKPDGVVGPATWRELRLPR